MTIEVDERTQKQLEAVREKCEELDKENPELGLVAKLDEALDYVARYADHGLEGLVVSKLSPDTYLEEGDEIDARHFSFIVNVYKPQEDGSQRYWFTMGMIYHNGAGSMSDGTFSVEINPQEGPHWSFHS